MMKVGDVTKEDPEYLRCCKVAEAIRKETGLHLDVRSAEGGAILYLDSAAGTLSWRLRRDCSHDENVVDFLKDMRSLSMREFVKGRVSLLETRIKRTSKEKDRVSIFVQDLEKLEYEKYVKERIKWAVL
jgi:hypothetical protein